MIFTSPPELVAPDSRLAVEGVGDGLRVGILVEIEMCHLAECVDAGIGAPGAEHPHPLTREPLDRGLDRLLDRRTVVLALPADET